MRDVSATQKDGEEARRVFVMSLEHADAKTPCRANDIDFHGDRGTSVARVVCDGMIV